MPEHSWFVFLIVPLTPILPSARGDAKGQKGSCNGLREDIHLYGGSI